MRACYNPRLFRAPGGAAPGEGTPPAAATCVALGSQDTKLTVWLSHDKRPLLVGSKLFAQSVVDLAWTPDGTRLLACSSDGTVGLLAFEAAELGEPFSQVRACTTDVLQICLITSFVHIALNSQWISATTATSISQGKASLWDCAVQMGAKYCCSGCCREVVILVAQHTRLIGLTS